MFDSIFRHRLCIELAALNAKSSSTTTDQRRAFQESSNRLHRRIIAWVNVQTMYIPELTKIREADAAAALAINRGIPPDIKVHEIKLYLPSSLPQNKCPDKFNEYEWRLREGQAYSALYDIRYQFRFKTHWSKFKTRFSRAVASNTRFNKTLTQSADKITHATATYRRAYKALVTLSGRRGMSTVCSPNWTTNLKELKDEDIRGLGDAGVTDDNWSASSNTVSEGRRLISWIWMLEGASDGSEDERTSSFL